MNNILSSLSIDPKQAQKIESEHKGFLYQHFYGAACLITFQKNGVKTLIAENDEDIQLLWPDKWIYIQIRTHSGLLKWDDIKEGVDRFERLRNEHNEGRRPGRPQFVIIANTDLDAELVADVQHKFWPKDITIQTPKSKKVLDVIPPAWSDLAQGFKWCMDNARVIHGVASETLVRKLASRIQHAVTGHNDYRIDAEEVPSLFEQLVIQLQYFPEAPQHYKPQENEPVIQSGDKIRLISGVSGSGKTAWAAQALLQMPDAGAYFDISDLPQSTLAGSIARGLVAQFLSNKTGIVAAILGAGSGPDMLSAIDGHFGKESIIVSVILDNAHLLSIDVIKVLLEASTNIKFILLAQPCSEMSLLETTLGIESEKLKGWSTDTIALELANAKCPAKGETLEQIKSLTLGLPLFVRNAVQVIAGSYGGSVKSFLKEIQSRNLILSITFKQLSPQALQMAGILSLVDVPLMREEIDEISEITIKDKALIDSSLKELNRYGIINRSISGEIKLHDIVRGLAKEVFQKTPGFGRVFIKKAIADVLQRSMPSTPGRFGLWIRLLAETDQTDVLVDLTTFEWFHEMGDSSEIKVVLEDASKSSTLSIEDRFWALDALTFWDTQDRLYDSVHKRLTQMEELARQGSLRTKARTSLAMKQMIASGFSGDSKGIESAFKNAVELANDDKNLIRIFEYNRAYAYHHASDYSQVKNVIEPLIFEYYKHLNLKPSDVTKNVDHILSVVSQISTWQDDLKHLADCLDLLASAKKQLGLKLGMEQVHALKFYIMSQALPSAIRVGQNVVDQLMSISPKEARRTIESILPIVQLPEFVKDQLQVRSQYALVLAHDGDLKAARSEIEEIKTYAVSQSQKEELEKQALLIEEIADGSNKKTDPAVSKVTRAISKPVPVEIKTAPAAVEHKSIGRNDPCYCGSGLKYKKCHGGLIPGPSPGGKR